MDSILKSRDITLLTKVHPVKAMIFFPVVMYGCESWTIKKTEQIDGFWTAVLEKTLESPLDCKEIQPVHLRRSVLGVLWKDWCKSWNSSTLATSCEELTHWKKLWCWEWLKVGGEGGDRGWDVWKASPTQWTWVWANSRRWWRPGKPGMLQSMGSQRVRHNLATEKQHNSPQLRTPTTSIQAHPKIIELIPY